VYAYKIYRMWNNTCEVDLRGVTVLLPAGAGDRGPTIDVGGLLGVPLNTSSSFCVSCANPCAAAVYVNR